MSFKPYTEKSKKKKIGICSILGRIRIHHPGSGSADPDPYHIDETLVPGVKDSHPWLNKPAGRHRVLAISRN